MYSILSGPFCVGRFHRLCRRAGLAVVQHVESGQEGQGDLSLHERQVQLPVPLFHWVVPFAGRNMRLRPEMTIVAFAFHIGLIITPIFLLGHNVMLERAFGFRLWTLSEGAADFWTLTVIFCGIFFLIRRLIVTEVRFVTTGNDYLLLAIAVAPFITGYLAHHQWLPYNTILSVHIACGGIMLVAIPFSRLSHMLYFPFTRAYMGSEFGAVRKAKDW